MIVFDRFSGNTHLLDELSLELVRELESTSISESGLIKNFAQANGLECDEALVQAVSQRLEALNQLGIVRADSV